MVCLKNCQQIVLELFSRVHWDDPEGWYGEGGGSGVQDGNMGTLMADSSQCMAKEIKYCKVK